MKLSAVACALLFTLPIAAQTAQTPQTPIANPANQTWPTTPAQQTLALQEIQLQKQLAEFQIMKAKLDDWAQLGRYRADNAALLPPAPGEQRVVFYGDSITDAWPIARFFPGRPYINRGISGQTTPQMLVRFQQDVVHLKPAAVIILAGTNDIAGNTGPETPEMIEDNLTSMAAIAKYYDIKVIFASILPAIAYPWKPGVHPADEIRALNTWLKDFARRDGDVYLDYYSALADAEGGMKPGLSKDGVHPTPVGYAIMSPLAEGAIITALVPQPSGK